MQSNQTIIDQLALYAHYTKLKHRGFKRHFFTANTYLKAAQAIHSIDRPIIDYGIRNINGIGEKLESKILEIINTGTFKELEKAIKKYGDLSELIRIRGIGIVKAYNLYVNHKIKTRTDLKNAIDNGMIKDRVLVNTSLVDIERIPYTKAYEISRNIIEILQDVAPKAKILCVGSMRRREGTIGDIDILSDSPKTQKAFIELGKKIESGNRKSSIVRDNRYIELNVISKRSWGTALLHSTGSSDFNKRMRTIAKNRGLKLNEYNICGKGIEKYFSEEEELFDFLNVEYVMPEHRNK